jgi:hypothetical protein
LDIKPPPLISWEEAEKTMTPMARSFYLETKRVRNERIKRDLGVRLNYPTYREGLAAVSANPQHQHVYALIASLISWHVANALEQHANLIGRDGAPVNGPVFEHCFRSDLEWYAGILKELAILAPVRHDADCYFVFRVKEQDVYNHVLSLTSKKPDFDEVLAAFVYHSIDYGGGFRVYRKKLFPVSREYDELFEALCGIGYAEKRGLEYQWTDRACDALVKAYAWPLHDDSDAHERRTGRK